MPQNRAQRMTFAFLTVLITVHAYVFYSIYVINGSTIMANTGASGVIAGVNAQGGILMFGHMLPIWAIVLIEFCCAFTLENVLGSPLSFRLACKVFAPGKSHPMLFESAIICATVGIMCPAMSFVAAWMYYPYPYQAFNFITLVANWLKLMCYNFPFAFFTQMFFIQPFVRTVFKLLFRKQIAAGEHAQQEVADHKPAGETEALADVRRKLDELQQELAEERSLRKELEKKLQ